MAENKFWLKGNRFDLRIPAKIIKNVEDFGEKELCKKWIKRLNKVLRYNKIYFEDKQTILTMRNYFITEYKLSIN